MAAKIVEDFIVFVMSEGCENEMRSEMQTWI